MAGHLGLGFFIAGLILMAPTFIVLARYAHSRVATYAGLAAALGTALLGLTSVTSLIQGDDSAIFYVLAPLTNAAWLFGAIVLAVILMRRSGISKVVAVGLPIAWFTSIPLATHGGGVLTGAYLLTVGYLLVTGGIERSAARVARPSRADALLFHGPRRSRGGGRFTTVLWRSRRSRRSVAGSAVVAVEGQGTDRLTSGLSPTATSC